MGRFPQAPGQRGSQRWIQQLVNEHPQVFDRAIGLGAISWRSPLKDDEYAEYRDDAFLQRLGVTLPRRPLADFWPAQGPQWDALGRAESGHAVLVEAKAHLDEICSPASQAGTSSLTKIRAALSETAAALGAAPGTDWTRTFYQYTNRLAHGHLLQELNGVPTRLIMLYFVGDRDMRGPETRREWEAALTILHEALGIAQRRLPAYLAELFIDVRPELPTVA